MAETENLSPLNRQPIPKVLIAIFSGINKYFLYLVSSVMCSNSQQRGREGSDVTTTERLVDPGQVVAFSLRRHDGHLCSAKLSAAIHIGRS